jgi:preprotein translocase subunit SecD
MSVIAYLKDRRILTLIIVVLLLGALDAAYGLHFGIEFIGGTQIPITLEHSVNVSAMGTLIGALDQRLSTFGLQQVTVEGIGDSEVYVVIPTVSASEVNQTISIINSQGRFEGIVNGREAINGSGIVKGSIGASPPQTFNNTVSWEVSFYITQPAEKTFAAAVFGQGNKPLYMYLDRPTSSAVLINASLLGNSSLGLTAAQSLKAMQNSLQFGNQTIPVISFTNTQSSMQNAESYFLANKGKYTTVITGKDTNSSLVSYLRSLNYTIKEVSRSNMTPTYIQQSFNETIIDSWTAVGLLSSPILNPALANGNVSNSYLISGASPPTLPFDQRLAYAQNKTKTITSILSGGALPVAVIPGTPTTIPPTLGSKFLLVSGEAGLIAILAVSVFIVLRYRKAFLIAPILITTVMELFIILSIIGLIGTIDLAAVAGMIAVIGTGVDAQVIITDEIVAKKSDSTAKTLLGNAFYIVWTDALLLVIAMMPLFFSTSLVDVIGFSEATIIGALLSVLITRPAYGAIVSRRYSN